MSFFNKQYTKSKLGVLGGMHRHDTVQCGTMCHVFSRNKYQKYQKMIQKLQVMTRLRGPPRPPSCSPVLVWAAPSSRMLQACSPVLVCSRRLGLAQPCTDRGWLGARQGGLTSQGLPAATVAMWCLPDSKQVSWVLHGSTIYNQPSNLQSPNQFTTNQSIYNQSVLHVHARCMHHTAYHAVGN